MHICSQGHGSLKVLPQVASGVHRSQAPPSGRRKEPKPCNALKATNSTIAWALEASEITDAYNSSSTSLADVAEELLRSESRNPKHENSSSSAGRLQEQLALQLEIALRAQEGLEERVQSGTSPPAQGRPPWNKGKKMSPATKQKISNAQKKRWRESPTLRASLIPKLKGSVPWNKGKKLSLETRLRMSLARKGVMQTKTTRRKISKANTDRPVSPETSAKMASALSGRVLTQEHKDAIAASQRRRLAAASILRAVEDVHSQQHASSPGSGAGRRMSGSGASGSGRQLQSTVLGSYKAELREFRALQEELQPWTDAFKEQHQGKPTLADVQATRIPWLINTYKQYVLMRERLLNDTQKLRTKLQQSIPEPLTPERNIQAFQHRMNANSSGAPNGKDAAARMASALEYRRTSVAASAAASAAQASNGSLSSGAGQSVEPTGSSAAAAPSMQSGNGQGAAGSEEGGSAERGGELSEKLARLSQSSPPRVASAMSAAVQYRKAKAAKTAAAARAAAAAAAAAGSGPASKGSPESSPGTAGPVTNAPTSLGNGLMAGASSGAAAPSKLQGDALPTSTSSEASAAASARPNAQSEERPSADVSSASKECT